MSQNFLNKEMTTSERKNSQFTIPTVRTRYHGSESISFLGPKIWNILPDRLKNANSIEAFKIQIKKWKPENCACRLCKVYVQNVSFVKSISIKGKKKHERFHVKYNFI